MYSDDPAKLSEIQKRRDRQKEDNERAKRKAELDAQAEAIKDSVAKVREFECTQMAAEMATEHKVAYGPVLDYLVATGSKEKTEAFAKTLPKTGEHVIRPPLHPDSGIGSGGGLTDEQKLKKRYPTMN